MIWFVLGGFWQALGWFIAGILCCCTIIGLPIGIQCFKLASFVLWPFGKQIVYDRQSAVSCGANVIWIVCLGMPLALSAIANGVLLCLTLIGVPFGVQCFKFAVLALAPFGARVVKGY